MLVVSVLVSCGGTPKATVALPEIPPDTLTHAELGAAAGSIRLAFARCLPSTPERLKVRVHVDGNGHVYLPESLVGDHFECIARSLHELVVANAHHHEADLTIVADYRRPGRDPGPRLSTFAASTANGPIEWPTGDPCVGAVPFGQGEHQLEPKKSTRVRLSFDTKDEIRITRVCVLLDGTALFDESLQANILKALAKREPIEWKGPLANDTDHDVRAFARVAADTVVELSARRVFEMKEETDLAVAIDAPGSSIVPAAHRVRIRIHAAAHAW